MKLSKANLYANELIKELSPDCHKVVVAGSIRRMKPEVNDIELVIIPKEFEVGLFATGIAQTLERYKKLKGNIKPGFRYTRREYKGVPVDIFVANKVNFGYIFTIRTGSQRYVKKLAANWSKKGYYGKDGYLHNPQGQIVNTPTETALFREILDITPPNPEKRIL